MSDPLPLTALSHRCVAGAGLQMGPAFPEVISDVEIGGPQDSTDRRLILDVKLLSMLLEVARSSSTRRVVLHKLGLRVQRLRDRQSGHVWDHLTLLGLAPEPEEVNILGLDNG